MRRNNHLIGILVMLRLGSGEDKWMKMSMV